MAALYMVPRLRRKQEVITDAVGSAMDDSETVVATRRQVIRGRTDGSLAFLLWMIAGTQRERRRQLWGGADELEHGGDD